MGLSQYARLWRADPRLGTSPLGLLPLGASERWRAAKHAWRAVCPRVQDSSPDITIRPPPQVCQLMPRPRHSPVSVGSTKATAGVVTVDP
jgi:hypothetical protein